MKRAGTPQNSGCSILLQFTSSLEIREVYIGKQLLGQPGLLLYKSLSPFHNGAQTLPGSGSYLRPGQKNTPRYPFVAFAIERIPRCCLFYLNLKSEPVFSVATPDFRPLARRFMRQRYDNFPIPTIFFVEILDSEGKITNKKGNQNNKSTN